ncbi:uncharacterized protein [Diabrotica undecimpunctata]|uniref:uncharacterized protein n=1 Tax=Diabrotica undecimpunctata TaxID=50387 RepID=UPI003B634877
MEYLPNIDLEELESSLYSQLYHSSEIQEESRLNLNLDDSLTDSSANKSYRYFLNPLEDSLNIFKEQQFSSTPANINTGENSIFSNQDTRLELPQPHFFSITSENSQGDVNNHSPPAPNVDSLYTDQSKKYSRRKRKTLRRSRRLQEKQELELIEKFVQQQQQQQNSVVIYISDSDSNDCVAVDEYMIDKRQINTKFPKKYNESDGGLPPERDDDIIFVPPPPVEVITVDSDETVQCNVVDNSIKNADYTEGCALVELDSSLSNDFLDTASVDRNSQFNFDLHGSEFTNNEIMTVQDTSKLTEYCETESSCSTNEPNRIFSNTVKTIVFDEVEFPKEAIFNEKDLESFGSFIVPKRTCNKRTDLPNEVDETESAAFEVADLLSDSNSSESDYETSTNQKSHDLPHLSPMITSDANNKKNKCNANEFFKDKLSVLHKEVVQKKKRKDSNNSSRKKKRDTDNETSDINFGSCITSTPSCSTINKKKKHSHLQSQEGVVSSTIQTNDILNVVDNDVTISQKPKKKKKKATSTVTTNSLNTDTSNENIEYVNMTTVESGNVEKIKTKRKKSNSGSKISEHDNTDIFLEKSGGVFDQLFAETVELNEVMETKETSKKKRKKRKNSTEFSFRNETVQLASDFNSDKEVANAETAMGCSNVAEFTKSKKKKRRESVLLVRLERSDIEHLEELKDLQDKNVDGKSALKQKKKTKETTLSKVLDNDSNQQLTDPKNLGNDDEIYSNEHGGGRKHSQDKNINDKIELKMKKKTKESDISNTSENNSEEQLSTSKMVENNDVSTNTAKPKKKKKEVLEICEVESRELVKENIDVDTTVLLKQKKKKKETSICEDGELNSTEKSKELEMSKESASINTEAKNASAVVETISNQEIMEVEKIEVVDSELDVVNHHITASSEIQISEKQAAIEEVTGNSLDGFVNTLPIELSNKPSTSNKSNVLNRSDLIIITTDHDESSNNQQILPEKLPLGRDESIICIDSDESEDSSVETLSSDSDNDFEVLDDSEHDLSLNISKENTNAGTIDEESAYDRIIREARLPLPDYDNYSVASVQSKQSDDPQKWMVLAKDKFSYLNQKKVGPRCYRCRHFGHTGDRCPDKPNPPPCILCGESGHQEARCPNQMCLQCGNKEEYSTSIYCRRCFKYREMMCNLCKMKGHLEKFCPDLWRRYYLTTDEGPMVISRLPTRPRNEQWCSGCARQGHLEHECNQNIRSFPTTSPYIMSYEDILEHNKGMPPVEHHQNIPATSTSSDSGNKSANLCEQSTSNENIEHSKIPSLLSMPMTLPNQSIINNFTPPNVTIRVSNEPSNIPCKEIIFQMRLNFDNQVNNQFKLPDDDKDLDVKAVKHLIMSMPSHVVINFLQKEMDILNNCNIDPRLLKRKIHKLDRLLDSKKKIPKKVLHEKNFWYKLLNMFVFGLYKYKDGNLHTNYLNRFLSQAKNIKLDRNKRTTLFSSYNYVFGCNKHLNVNYFKIIRLLIKKHYR